MNEKQKLHFVLRKVLFFRIVFITVVIIRLSFSAPAQGLPAVQSKMPIVTCSYQGLNSKRLTINYQIENTMSEAMFLASDPVQLFGSRGHYVSFEQENGVLNVSSRVFPDPPFYPLVNNVSVTVKRLDAKKSANGVITLDVPIKRTSPPYDRRRGSIGGNRVKEISLTIGIFTNPEIRFLSNRPVKGSETLPDTPNRQLLDEQVEISAVCKQN